MFIEITEKHDCDPCKAAGEKNEAIKKVSAGDETHYFCEDCYLDFLLGMNKKADELIGQLRLYCLRCVHSWPPRGSEKPRICPKCKSPYWDRKKK